MAEVRMLLETEHLRVGTFRCPPGDPLWRTENCIGGGHHVVFPATGVRITQGGSDPFVANPLNAVLYNAGQTYRRGLVSSQGDRCSFVVVHPALLARLLEAPSRPPHGEGHLFEAPEAAVDPTAYLKQAGVVQHLRDAARRGTAPDLLFVEESLFEVLGRTLAASRPRSAESSTDRGQSRVVEDVKELLATRFDENLSLASIGREVHRSPFHLARLFRRLTGRSIHEHRTQLRLRSGLSRLEEGRTDLASLAFDLGFSSHSHFTAAFRRTFGVPPSAVRGSRGLRSGRALPSDRARI
jgi:AraC-like DNA-binding protein